MDFNKGKRKKQQKPDFTPVFTQEEEESIYKGILGFSKEYKKDAWIDKASFCRYLREKMPDCKASDIQINNKLYNIRKKFRYVSKFVRKSEGGEDEEVLVSDFEYWKMIWQKEKQVESSNLSIGTGEMDENAPDSFAAEEIPADQIPARKRKRGRKAHGANKKNEHGGRNTNNSEDASVAADGAGNHKRKRITKNKRTMPQTSSKRHASDLEGMAQAKTSTEIVPPETTQQQQLEAQQLPENNVESAMPEPPQVPLLDHSNEPAADKPQPLESVEREEEEQHQTFAITKLESVESQKRKVQHNKREPNNTCVQTTHHVASTLDTLVEILKFFISGNVRLKIVQLNYEKFLVALRWIGLKTNAAEAEAMYSEWTRLVKSIHWHPFKFDNSEGTPKRVVDKNDAKLRELKDNYGQYLCNEVVRVKLELQDPITIDTGEALWNFVEDRKATEEEAMDVLLKIHRLVNAVKNKSCSSANEPVLQQDGGNASQREQTTRRRTAMEDSSACAQSHHVEPILKALVEIRKDLVEEIVRRNKVQLNYEKFLVALRWIGLKTNEAKAEAEAMYSEWTRHVKSIHWHPFKFDNSEGTPKRVVDKNDAKLRELKDNYGQYLCNEVVRVKLELQDLIDIGNLETLWSFVEDRKAAEEEAMDVILNIDRIVKTVKNKSCSSGNEPVLQQDGGNASQREQTTTRRTSMEVEKEKDVCGEQLESNQRSNPLDSRKKLLVLDLNGLLADIVSRQIHKRPSCEDFLNFCFDKFEVGVWSSRIEKNVKVSTDQLLGDLKEKLVFCWDQKHCTMTTVGCPERNEKPIMFKNLNKLWEKQHPDVPWKKGDYNKTNTVLLDDSPYKALLNPPYTAIFPQTYNHQNQTDTSLGSGGDLRLYLEKLVEAENVQEFIKKNPFGQEAITEASNCYETYKLAISSVKEETSN